MAVSKETIVEASIKILNRDGIENLSMRTIAKELDIKAASLYWHVSGKQELYGEIAEYLCSRLILPKASAEEGSANAKSYLLEIHKAYRAMLLTTRDSVLIFENSVPNTPRRIEVIKAVIQSLLEMGIQAGNCMTASNMINNYVLSFVADEVRIKSRTSEEIAAFSSLLGIVGSIDMFVEKDFDQQFLYGLRVLFAGLETVDK
jgi:AcrR family transcriptional regulator